MGKSGLIAAIPSQALHSPRRITKNTATYPSPVPRHELTIRLWRLSLNGRLWLTNRGTLHRNICICWRKCMHIFIIPIQSMKEYIKHEDDILWRYKKTVHMLQPVRVRKGKRNRRVEAIVQPGGVGGNKKLRNPFSIRNMWTSLTSLINTHTLIVVASSLNRRRMTCPYLLWTKQKKTKSINCVELAKK